MNDGLASNAVRNIGQDKNGYIWFGTDNGLCRYDGRRVLPLRIAELGVNQYISAMLVGDEGIYVGTVKGVNIVDGSPKIIAEYNGQTYQVAISDVRQVADSVL